MCIKSVMALLFILSSTGTVCKASVNFHEALLQNLELDKIAGEIKNTVIDIEKTLFDKAVLTYVFLPPEDDDSIMPQIIDKTTQKIAQTWLMTINTSFCCESHEIIFNTPQQNALEYLPDIYIIPLKKGSNETRRLDAQIKKMSEENSYNPKAIFIMIILTSLCGEYQEISLTSSYFNIMWSRNCFSVILLVLSECDLKVSIVTATPFSKMNECRKIQENGTMLTHSKLNKEEIEKYSHLSNNQNFNKCQFLVGTISSPPYVIGKIKSTSNKMYYEFIGGIDIELLRLVSGKYNFTYVFDQRHGNDSSAMIHRLPNGTYIGMFVDLLVNNLDIFVDGIIPHYRNYYRYSYSHNYKYSTLDWFVSDASLSPAWKIFLGAFGQHVWILLSFFFVTTCFIYFLMDHFTNNMKESKKGFCKSFLRGKCKAMPWIQYFSIALALSSLLKPKSICLRVLLFSWSIYSFHICTAYSTILFSLISNPPLDTEIRTIEDLEHSGLKVGSNSLIFSRFKRVHIDKTTKTLLNNSFKCPQWTSCIEALINHRNFCLLIGEENLEYYVNIKKSKIHKISEAFFSYGASVLMSKGSPLYQGLNKLISFSYQTGLFTKWDKDIKSNFNIVKRKEQLVSEKTLRPLTVKDLKGTIVILIFGFLNALLLFIGEVVVNFLNKLKIM